MSRALWVSPLSAETVAAGACLLAEPWVGEDAFYWLQSLSAEGGRVTVMTASADAGPRSLIPAPYSVRSRVNEYGGGAWAVAADAVWFVNEADQGLYRVEGGRVEQVFQSDDLALGDLAWDAMHKRMFAVAEVVRGADAHRQRIVAIRPDGTLAVLATGADFYGAPRPAPDGRRMVWLEWSEPDMPWDATRLMGADLAAEGALSRVRHLAGGPGESLAQPEWSPAGGLYVVSDRDGGFWNLHRLGESGLVPVRRIAAECARPAFVFAQRLYAFTPGGGLILAEAADGLWRCLEGRLEGGDLTACLPDLTEVVGLHAGAAGTAVLAGGAATPLTFFVRFRGETSFRALACSLDLALDPGFVSRPEALSFTGADGAETHALYFPPAHPEHRATEAAPVRVRCHGGPTSAASSALEPKTLYWTSRGFGALELNYRGSTGYGRDYREALYGQWGLADSEDACAAAQGLIAQGIANPARLAIAGGSAGGFTALNALVGDSPYAAGASHYGVADLATLAASTHRFEAHYGERLIGPWPAARAAYEARSPLKRVRDIKRAAIFFQGLDDPVVPPAQSERMAHALAACGLPVVLETFVGERHGFRRPATISRVLAAELAFYLRVLDLSSSESLPELDWLGNAPPADIIV
ncbi:MAG: prolyl oligopeptidase family serine peptidase [Gammaproteobacteria bacterium]